MVNPSRFSKKLALMLFESPCGNELRYHAHSLQLYDISDSQMFTELQSYDLTVYDYAGRTKNEQGLKAPSKSRAPEWLDTAEVIHGPPPGASFPGARWVCQLKPGQSLENGIGIAQEGHRGASTCDPIRVNKPHMLRFQFTY